MQLCAQQLELSPSPCTRYTHSPHQLILLPPQKKIHTLQGEDFTADCAATSPVSQRLFVLATIMLVVGRSREGCRTGFGAFVEV